MSLRVRLVLLIVALVALVAMALSLLYLDNLINTLSTDALERSEQASQQVKAFVIGQINQHAPDYQVPAGLDETKTLWNGIVAADPDLPAMLEKMLALSPALVEINIAGQTDRILASSNPLRLDARLAPLEPFAVWKSRPLYRRMVDLIARRPDYQVRVPLGFAGQSDPVFTIQVVASTVLLRSALLPQVETLAAVSGGALLISLVLTVFGTNRVLRPLKRIELTIDRIVQGNYRGEESRAGMAKEFAVVESKLNLLGQQYRGAREDATELKHNIEELLERMASQLDVASRLAAISRITGGVAHEIKNPLNAISLRLDLLRARLGAPEEELAAEIDILSKEVRRLDRVVKTFLDFSRPLEVRLQEVDLAVLAAEVADLFAPQARLAGVALRFEAKSAEQSTEGSSSMLIRGDPDMLKQAILNLVTNALEAMKSGGNLVLSALCGDGTITLEVADDGPGIPPDLRDKVFQLYFTTKPKGSGIGLAMTYRAVQLHNGTIDFTSEDGRGTTFRLQFPAVVGHA
jgi:signal transduction histidine kinase